MANRLPEILFLTRREQCPKYILMDIVIPRVLPLILQQENYGKLNLARVVVMRSISYMPAKIMAGPLLPMALNTVVKRSAKPFNRKPVWNSPFIIGILSYLQVVFVFIAATLYPNGKIICLLHR